MFLIRWMDHHFTHPLPVCTIIWNSRIAQRLSCRIPTQPPDGFLQHRQLMFRFNNRLIVESEHHFLVHTWILLYNFVSIRHQKSELFNFMLVPLCWDGFNCIQQWQQLSFAREFRIIYMAFPDLHLDVNQWRKPTYPLSAIMASMHLILGHFVYIHVVFSTKIWAVIDRRYGHQVHMQAITYMYVGASCQSTRLALTICQLVLTPFLFAFFNDNWYPSSRIALSDQTTCLL